MPISLNGKGLEAALIKMSLSNRPMGSMPPLGVRHGHPPHEARKVVILPGPQHEVPMVRHETITEEAHRGLLASLGKNLLEGSVILVCAEDRSARVRAVQSMIYDSAVRCP